MENNQQQYLNPETYIGVIQELSNTISNLQVELALSKTQYKEIMEYTQKLQDQLNQRENTSSEVVGVEVNE